MLKFNGRPSHAFGNPFFSLTLPFARWRPRPVDCRGPYGWLVRRAAAIEGGTGQAAAIRWQIHCQDRWLRLGAPSVLAWPWENHAWERALARSARHTGVRTLGYQHSVIGRQMLNYSPASNPDGDTSLPERIFCTGAATHDQLIRWHMPAEKLAVAGALRFGQRRRPMIDRAAPVFVALPFDPATAREMVAPALSAAAQGRKFLVKDHPMTPYTFRETIGVRRTDRPLGSQEAVSAVVFAATTVGLEALIAGLPVLRFQPHGRIALDILPDDLRTPTADANTLADAPDRLGPPPRVDAERIFAPVDIDLWRMALETP